MRLFYLCELIYSRAKTHTKLKRMKKKIKLIKGKEKPRWEKRSWRRTGWRCFKGGTDIFCCLFLKARLSFLSSQCPFSRIYVQNISIFTSFVVQIFCTSDFRFPLIQVENQRLISTAWWNTWLKWCACHHSEVWVAEDKTILFSRATFVNFVSLRLRTISHLLQTNTLYKTLINSQSIFILWGRHSRKESDLKQQFLWAVG